MFVIKYLCVLFTIFRYATGSNTNSVLWKEGSEDISYRLSNTTEPVSYELWLETKIHDRILDYTGRVRILLRALEISDTIVINSENLQIIKYSLLDHISNQIKITHYEEYKKQTILAFFLDESLRVSQNYVLDIEFTGRLQSGPQGFGYTRNVDENGNASYMATSFLHLTHARKAFPCYDEPRYRNSFIIHITHLPVMRAASNMPIASIVNNSDGTVTTSFQESVPMSVGLVAFTVCNYESRKVIIEDKNLEISFLVAKNQLDELDFAIDYIVYMMNKLEDYLGIGYNLPKLESTIVNDFMHTGLEYWGLMVYDSKCLLYNESLTTISQKMDIVRTICHLLTHNYFGNLVGYSWWNSGWMIEGFAYYYEYSFSNSYISEFPTSEILVTDLIQRYLVENSYATAVSLSRYADIRKDIESSFGFGVLSKAAAIIRMSDHMLGKTTFQKGLQKYVKDMAFKVAEPKDLCRNLQEAVDEDHSLPDDIKVEDALKSWIDQPGYPLITVIRNYESNEIVVNQQRFLSSREEVDTEGLSWYIPLSITTSKNPDMNDTKPSVWLKGGTRELVLRTSENLTWTSEDWVLFNIDQTGYYRVNYDTQNWKLLADELHKGFPYTIGTLNRAQIIDDAFNLAYSDVVHFTMALDIIKYVKYENEYSVWITANRHLLNMNRRLDGHSYELYYGRFLQHLTEDHFAHLDVFEDFYGRDSIGNTLLRPIIADLACRSGSGKCLTATRIMVTAEALTGHILVPHEKPSVYYCHGLKNADENTFQYFWNKMKTVTNEQEKIHITSSIGCYHNFESVYSLLLETADPELSHLYYTNLDRFQILINSIRNGHVKVILKFLRENHKDIAQTYTYNNFRMEQALKDIAECLQEEDKEDYVDMLEVLLSAGHISPTLYRRYINDMEYNRIWVQENKQEIENWIGEYFQPKVQSSGMIIMISIPVIVITLGQIIFPIF